MRARCRGRVRRPGRRRARARQPGTVVRFHQELLAGDEVEVSCVFSYGPGKTGRVTQEMHRADGVLAATVESVIGLLDLRTRRLVPDPAGRWREFATDPALLGV
ncbi:thioesterase family protein [Streptomyces sp. ISL-100]|uniref:thioesterase family protein n=1 Tax=Streptomyces sp. ISL-100 TaxID=2819173 RepID=UPI0027E3D1CF|nr:thioesterase family protein [Streptomyces sp. ISL-100]